ncbi:hypothetical protein [Arcicella rosea]|uniref:Uncharacterized protein n=1 Tax=Arcicella rosea TaxID=502909 RepID=A0A841ES86_9BACT|nr:hypothetical protein [Arcicella rosea]MBB6003893.1 hypothetical protein [Arcicella rosea]
MSNNSTDDFFITILAKIIAFFLVIISGPILAIIYITKKRTKIKETLFQQCIKELTKRRIPFVVYFSESGGWIGHLPEQATNFYISFRSDNEVLLFFGEPEDEMIITTMDELLKLKPFIENDK